MASQRRSPNCSKQAALLTDLAMKLAQMPGVDTVDDVLREVRASHESLRGFTREDLVAAIVEATTHQAHVIDKTSAKLQEIKREARRDADLRKAIVRLENAIAAHAALDAAPKREAKEPTEAVAELVAARDALKKAFSKSEPVIRQRFERQIGNLTKQLEEGVSLPPVREAEMPLSPALEKLRYDRDRQRRAIRDRIDQLKPKTLATRAAMPFNAARQILTSWDVSAVGRQGHFILFAHPIRAIQAMRPMFQALKSEQDHYKINDDILNGDMAPVYRRAGLYLAPADPMARLTNKEEQHQSHVSKWLPGIAASERAYTTYLNMIRAATFDAMYRSLARRNGTVSQADLEAIGNFINAATGRGNLGKGVWNQAAQPLAQVFFSPRLVVSRLQLITGQPLWSGTMESRKLIAQEYGRYFAGLMAMYALVGLMTGGDDDEEGITTTFDPRSSDFGKFKIGDTRLDPLGGHAQVATLMARLWTGETVDLRTGRDKKIHDRFQTLARFARSKMSPIAGTATNALAGRDFSGKVNTDPRTLEGAKNLIQPLLGPMQVQDIYDAMIAEGVPAGAAMGALSLFGISLQTHTDDDTHWLYGTGKALAEAVTQ